MKLYKKTGIIVTLVLFLICNTSVYAITSNTKKDEEMKPATSADLKDSIKRSKYNILLDETIKKEGQTESSYNLKEKLQEIKVKDQLSSGACWAFSFSSLIETSIAKQHNKVSREYSPMHIEYKTAEIFNRKVGSGAGPRLSTAYAVSGYGPILESKMTFSSLYNDETKTFATVTDLDKGLDARIKEMKMFPQLYKKNVNGEIKYYADELYSSESQYSTEETTIIRNLIKEHIKNYGGISADIYMDENNYYNSATAAYNYNDYENTKQPNHVVTIVGWDDNYETTGFEEGTQPLNKGAYIALNSYGTDWGKNGYMYISYEDACIEGDLYGIENIEEYENEKKDYDKIYQYDELGMNMMLPIGGQTASTEDSEKVTYTLAKTSSPQTSIYAASKYARESIEGKDEYINEVGIYLPIALGVEIYINPSSDNLEETQLVAVPENALDAGYHTIKLASPLKLTGDKFAVKVKYTNQEGAYVPVEVNYKESQIGGTSAFYDTATANDGEGFISVDNINWGDVNKSSIVIAGTDYTLKNASTCIKAFTIYQEKTSEEISVTGIELNKIQTTIKIDATETLTATVTPENATNKNVSWESSDETIATVNNGVVTAIKEGTATITAKTEDGEKTATCTVTVEKEAGEEPPLEEVKVTGVTLSDTEIILDVNDTENLTATVTPENATNKKVNWTSSDETVATVSNGVVTGIKVGNATITVTTEDGTKTATCKVTVQDITDIPDYDYIFAEAITLNKTSVEVEKGKKFNLEATFEPENTTNKTIEWTSSNEKVATVSDTGIITAIGEGTTTITATSIDGATASCKVTVKAKTSNPDDIYTEDDDNKGTNQNNGVNTTEDGTVADKQLPNTGERIAIISAIMLGLILAITLFIRYRSFKDIK